MKKIIIVALEIMVMLNITIPFFIGVLRGGVIAVNEYGIDGLPITGIVVVVVMAALSLAMNVFLGKNVYDRIACND